MTPLAPLSRPSRWLAGRAAAWVALWLALGCNTPSVPLPPPSPSDFDIAFAQQSLALSGRPQPTRPGARYEVYNASLGRGVIIRAAADGSFTSPAIEGGVGDHLEISYQLDPDTSDYVSGIPCIVVPPAPGGLTESDRCPD